MIAQQKRLLAFVFIAGGFLLAQCAGMGGVGRSGSAFDALGFPGDDTVLTAGVPPRAADDDADGPGAFDTLGVNHAGIVSPVLRVQFFATTSLTEAEDMKRRAHESLSQSVSIDFETPYYKLTIGPLKDEDTAERLVVQLRAMGYESAWIVRERADGRPRSR
jgi:hypothetical protein